MQRGVTSVSVGKSFWLRGLKAKQTARWAWENLPRVEKLQGIAWEGQKSTDLLSGSPVKFCWEWFRCSYSYGRKKELNDLLNCPVFCSVCLTNLWGSADVFSKFSCSSFFCSFLLTKKCKMCIVFQTKHNFSFPSKSGENNPFLRNLPSWNGCFSWQLFFAVIHWFPSRKDS